MEEHHYFQGLTNQQLRESLGVKGIDLRILEFQLDFQQFEQLRCNQYLIFLTQVKAHPSRLCARFVLPHRLSSKIEA